MDILKIARILDVNGAYGLADKLDKYADQGVLIPRGPGGVSLLDMIGDFFDQSMITDSEGNQKLDFNKINSLIQNSFLKNIISRVELEENIDRLGAYDRKNKILYVDANPTFNTIQNIKSSIQHELTHGASPIYQKFYKQKKINDKWYTQRSSIYEKMNNVLDEKDALRLKLNSGDISKEEFDKQYNILDEQYKKYKLELDVNTKIEPKVIDPSNMTSRGRIPYFTDEEIMAQTTDLKNAFSRSNIDKVYEKFYKSDKVGFLKDLKKFIATLPLIENVQSQLLNSKNAEYFSPSNINNILENLPEHKKYYIDALMTGDKSKVETAEQFILAKEQQRLLKLHLPQVDFIDKIQEVSGIRVYPILRDIKDPKYFSQMRKFISNDIIKIEQDWGLKEKHKPLRSELPKQKEQNVFVDDDVNDDITEKKINSDVIEQQTSKLVGNKSSTPRSKSNLSKILPTINKLFKQLGVLLEKFNNTKTSKIFNYGMLAKDVYFIITLSDKISKQINAGEEVMMKDQLDLGLTIISILTDQQTQSILKAIFPPLIVFLNNPQLQAWLVGINISANVLSGAVNVADYLGTLSGTKNQNIGTMSGIQNVPGSAQALVMPIFQLREKYGEVYNALIDIEKGLSIPQAINKHIMKDASGNYEPYRLSLLYKFTNNKNKILEYQKSDKFKKLPIENQLLYPNASSAYAISSYKKARDAAQKSKEQTNRAQIFSPGFGGMGYVPSR